MGIAGRIGGGGPNFVPQGSTSFSLVDRYGGGKVETEIIDTIKCNNEQKGNKRSLKYCIVRAWGV